MPQAALPVCLMPHVSHQTRLNLYRGLNIRCRASKRPRVRLHRMQVMRLGWAELGPRVHARALFDNRTFQDADNLDNGHACTLSLLPFQLCFPFSCCLELARVLERARIFVDGRCGCINIAGPETCLARGGSGRFKSLRRMRPVDSASADRRVTFSTGKCHCLAVELIFRYNRVYSYNQLQFSP